MFIKPVQHRSYSNQIILTTFLWLSISIIYTYGIVDYIYCKPYVSDTTDNEGHVNDEGKPLLYMGETWEKKYYLTSKGLAANFFSGVYNICERFGLTVATVKTVCEYGIVEKWFFNQYPTNYSMWVAGMRFGNFFRPTWIPTGEAIDLSQFEMNLNLVPGPYPPGGYSPIAYPSVNCLSVSRNCLRYTGGPTSPCPTYPDVHFMWEDCDSKFRVMCEKIVYTKGTNLDLEENDIETR